MNKHGELLYFWEGDLLTVNAKGPFNDEGILSSGVGIKKAILSQNIKNWRRLEILDEETLGSPSVLALVKDLFDWYLDNGCERVAVVVCNSVQQAVIEKMLQSSDPIFRNFSDAKKWLNAP